jgi:WD40 repeat protein/tRNA A-37 threonylcarbamoyl transferase component Bud32
VSQFSSNQPQAWIGRVTGDDNRYRLDQYLGGGGMGDVFLATDTRLGKSVALKLLKDPLIANDLDLRQRFERECTICAALKSVHIVQVSDYGVTSEGYPFYVMEYLQGQTLGQLLSTQPRLSIEQTCSIITQVCAGLRLAHEGVMIWNRETNASERIKVVHRDLKPDNIFLLPTTLGQLAKIIDFGIAKIYSLHAESTHTTSIFLGTCHYASPEQFDGWRAVDERSDIYSLGVILYEMLSGTDPFGFDFHHHPVTNTAWLTAHASKPPQPLRSHPGCEPIPSALDAVVMRCLAKLPDQRFASVAELGTALQGISTADLLSLPLAAAQLHSHAAAETLIRDVSEPDATLQNLSPASPALLPAADASVAPSPTIHRQRPSRRLLWLLGGTVLALSLGFYAVFRTVSQLPSTPSRSVRPVLPDPTVARTIDAAATDSLALAASFAARSPVRAAVLSPDGQTLISSGDDRDAAQLVYPITVWDATTQQVRLTLNHHTDTVQSLSLSSDGQLLASGSRDHTIHLWHVTTGELLQTLTGHSAPVTSVVLSPDGQTLVSGSEDKTVRRWDLRTGTSRTAAEHTGPVHGVALSPNGSLIASGSEDKTIKLWDGQTGELLRTLGEPGGHPQGVSAVSFSPEGRLASASWDGSIKLWNPATGQLLQTLDGHAEQVTSLVFVDAQTLASASSDRTIKLWDAQTGELRQTLLGHAAPIVSLSCWAETLVSGSRDTTIKLWR